MSKPEWVNDVKDGESEWDNPQATEISFDVSDMNVDDLKGLSVVKTEGWYHFEIVDVKPDLRTVNEKGEDFTPRVDIRMQVVCAAPGLSKPGSSLFVMLFLAKKGGGPPSDFSRQQTVRFCLGAGVMKLNANGKLIDAATGESKISVKTFENLLRRQVCGKVRQKKQDNEDIVKYGEKFELEMCRTFDPRDPAVKHVPKDDKVLSVGEYDMSAPPSWVWDEANLAEEPPQDETPASLDEI